MQINNKMNIDYLTVPSFIIAALTVNDAQIYINLNGNLLNTIQQIVLNYLAADLTKEECIRLEFVSEPYLDQYQVMMHRYILILHQIRR